jgi:hypothetical protein
MWPGFKLHVGEFSRDRGSFNRAQGLWELCRSHLVFFGNEHADVDFCFLCRAGIAYIVDDISPGQELKTTQNEFNK